MTELSKTINELWDQHGLPGLMDFIRIPSKSTLTRIFVMIDPKWLGLSIVGIVQSLIKENKKVRTDIYSDDYNTDYNYREKYIFENDVLINS